MARQRMIQLSFWTDEALSECSMNARLLFIGTWNFADDEGNLIRSAKQIKAQVFPYDNIECESLICELITHDLLIEYSVSGKFYLHIKNFKKHQIINRPSKPQCPLYEDSLSTHPEVKEVKEVKEIRDGAKTAPTKSTSETPKTKPDPAGQIFDLGTVILGANSRSIIGKARKDVGDQKTLEILAGMAAMKPPLSEPVSYFMAAIKPKVRGLVI